MGVRVGGVKEVGFHFPKGGSKYIDGCLWPFKNRPRDAAPVKLFIGRRTLVYNKCTLGRHLVFIETEGEECRSMHILPFRSCLAGNESFDNLLGRKLKPSGEEKGVTWQTPPTTMQARAKGKKNQG